MPANWERGRLTINDQEHWPGFYHRTQYWNGWRIPGFSNRTARQVLDWVVESNKGNVDYKWRFDKENDQFILTEIGDEDTEDYDIEYQGFDLVYKGKTYHVYPIGSHEWIWDLYEPPPPRSKSFFTPGFA